MMRSSVGSSVRWLTRVGVRRLWSELKSTELKFLRIGLLGIEDFGER